MQLFFKKTKTKMNDQQYSYVIVKLQYTQYNCFYLLLSSLANRLTELLEDFQKIISVQVDENDEKTLEIVSKDFKTLQSLWNKFRQEGPGQTLAGRKVDFGTFFICLSFSFG